jgi:ADP-ribose pyrophosphatase YjhB (NUDIX family)
MIKKNTTYHFAEFLNGKYSTGARETIIRLFNGMSFYEKKDILSLNFSQMWYRLHNENDYVMRKKSNSYIKKKSKFENAFMCDGGKFLNELMSESKITADTPWEFPRGRKQNNEKDINTALRELQEEAGVNIEQIKILYHIDPYRESYTDYRVKYKNTYYFAEMEDEKYNPFIDATNISGEVSNISWISLGDLESLKLDDNSKKRLKMLLKNVSSRYRTFRKNQKVKVA